MKYFFLILVLFIFGLLQSSLINVNFVLIFSMSLFLLGNKDFTPVAFFVSGLMLDLLGTGNFGLYALVMSLILVCITLLKRLFGFGVIVKLIMCLFAFVAFYFVSGFDGTNMLSSQLYLLLKNFIALALIFPFVYKFDEYFDQSSQF